VNDEVKVVPDIVVLVFMSVEAFFSVAIKLLKNYNWMTYNLSTEPTDEADVLLIFLNITSDFPELSEWIDDDTENNI